MSVLSDIRHGQSLLSCCSQTGSNRPHGLVLVSMTCALLQNTHAGCRRCVTKRLASPEMPRQPTSTTCGRCRAEWEMVESKVVWIAWIREWQWLLSLGNPRQGNNCFTCVTSTSAGSKKAWPMTSDWVSWNAANQTSPVPSLVTRDIPQARDIQAAQPSICRT